MIYIDKTSGIPLYKQIYSSIASDILTGVIPSGHRLPSTRKLAQELSVGRNTAEKAYKQLEAEGYILPGPGAVLPPRRYLWIFREVFLRIFLQSLSRP